MKSIIDIFLIEYLSLKLESKIMKESNKLKRKLADMLKDDKELENGESKYCSLKIKYKPKR
mgnify:CR=1 FL=1